MLELVVSSHIQNGISNETPRTKYSILYTIHNSICMLYWSNNSTESNWMRRVVEVVNHKNTTNVKHSSVDRVAELKNQNISDIEMASDVEDAINKYLQYLEEIESGQEFMIDCSIGGK